MRAATLLLAVTAGLISPSLRHHRSGAPSAGRAAPSDSASAWAGALLGRWSCAGAFASGPAPAAELQYRPVLGGQWLAYHHADRPPGRYEATALLGPAIPDSALVSTVLYDDFGGHRRFEVRETPGHGVQLSRDTTEAGARAERFSFLPRADGTLWFAWEVQRSGAWALGDSLACARGAP